MDIKLEYCLYFGEIKFRVKKIVEGVLHISMPYVVLYTKKKSHSEISVEICILKRGQVNDMLKSKEK